MRNVTLEARVLVDEEMLNALDLSLVELNGIITEAGRPPVELGGHDVLELTINDVPDEATDQDVISIVAGSYGLDPSNVTVKE